MPPLAELEYTGIKDRLEALDGRLKVRAGARSPAGAAR